MTSEEDLCSQFNYLWSAYIIAGMGILITLVQYVGNPIYCWCPAEMPQAQCNYTMALCWVKENYYVSEKDTIATQEKDRYNIAIAYYPWVPWILLFTSAMLNLPHIIWRSFLSSSGLDLRKLVSLADSHASADNLARILRIWLVKTNHHEENVKTFLGSGGFFGLGKHHRTYLCGLVILVKVLYLVVSVGLYFSLNIFIDEDFFMYGYVVIENFLKGIPQSSVRFPKETVCDMKIRQMSNIHTYSIQCILPINLYNEKIFIILWYWFILLIIINMYSLVKWACHLLSYASRRSFVKEYVITLFYLLSRKKLRWGHKPGNTTSEINNTEETINHKLLITDAIFYEHNPKTKSDTAPRVRRKGRRVIRDIILPRHDEHRLLSNIETTEQEMIRKKLKQKINRVTTKMLRMFGHDGVVVFRTLEDAVGIVIAHEIFQEFYQQVNDQDHYR